MLSLSRFVFVRNFSRCSQVLLQKAQPKEKQTKDPPRDRSIVHHEQYNINYKRLELNDKILSNLMLLTKSKKKLSREQKILVEGRQLIVEAIQSDIKLNQLIFSHVEKLEPVIKVLGEKANEVQFMKVPQQDLTFWSVLTTCPGLMGIFDKPHSIKPKENALPITVICDNIREPNNVGAVIRLCNALPAAKVLLPKGNADAWDTKAIRGSSGSVFFMPTEDDLSWQEVDCLMTSNTIVLVADNNTSKYYPRDMIEYDKIPEDLIAGKDIVVIIGGETHGIGEDARNFLIQKDWRAINISLDQSVDSLNVSNALAIILFELRRKLSSVQ